MSNQQSRLQFTEKERSDPLLGEAIRKVEKAAEKADKAQQKIPQKKVIKSELITDNSNGKIKVKLHFEDAEKKPPSKLNVSAKDVPRATMKRRIRQEMRQEEDDNAGIDAAHEAVETSETASSMLHEAYHSAQLKPYKAAEKAERKLGKANVNFLQKKAEIENPTSNPFSKWRQKQEMESIFLKHR